MPVVEKIPQREIQQEKARDAATADGLVYSVMR